MKKVKKIFSWVPNFITLLGLFSGSLAVFFAIDGHLSLAGIFILIAAVFDFFDGMAARLLKAYSEIGKQLDSLADVISFGFAPGAILFTLFEYSLFGKNQLIQDIEGNTIEWLFLFSSLLIPVFSALRLAKFNISENQNKNFIGLPTPANALLWASLGLMLGLPKYTEVLKILYTSKNLLILVIITSILLVSRIPMFSFKFNNMKWGQNWFRYMFMAVAIVLLILINVYAIPILFLLYVLMNMALYITGVEF
ncbi:MAG: CDP-diacylglycerol--serine O-phosphatidyltransferase [Prolixibacteraceae bacterium]|nr:CDP-diacylglycerol--serine O-phosphatidyltransferase [Prolixibacteraceae bacterium]MBN2775775.1 CDP-diacylglycerol--serine O-phosphatidyltransferase [Prolixibacteraceae bacterium]